MESRRPALTTEASDPEPFILLLYFTISYYTVLYYIIVYYILFYYIIIIMYPNEGVGVAESS